jgi:CheY-like chemotaxis protein
MADAASGWHALDLIRADAVTCHLPVIVCSAEPDLTRQVQARADACLAAVRKPFRPDTLLATIKHLVEPISFPGAPQSG